MTSTMTSNDGLSLGSAKRSSIKVASARLRSVLSLSTMVGMVRRKGEAPPVRFQEVQIIREPHSPAKSTKAGMKPNEDALAPTSALGRSKSRLVRMLTTKKQKDDDSTPRPSRLPAAAPGGHSKEQREAALRARGLLPPLSLSQQERELDNTIPIVKPRPLSEGEDVSAADLIKQQWEAKNKEQRQRLGSFKFGAGTSPTDDSSSPFSEPNEPKKPKDEPRSGLSSPEEPIQKLTTKAQRRLGVHQASLSQPMRIEAEALRDSHHRSSSLHNNKALPSVPAPEAGLSPPTLVLDLPTEFQSYLDTPPSPQQMATDLTPTATPESRISSAKNTPVKDRHGRRSPQPLKTQEVFAAPTRSDTLVAPNSAISPTETLVNASHARTNSSPRAGSGSSSILTPSLDSASSTTKSNESIPNGKGGKAVGKSIENGIPVIMESSESGVHEAQSMEHVSNEDKEILSSSGHDSDYEFLPPPPVPPREAGRVRRRGDQASPRAEKTYNPTPEAAPTRRKTINPFKRNQQQSSANDATPTKRSFAMISRSVVGTVMRPRREAESAETKASVISPQERSVSPPISPSRRPYYRQQPPPQPVVVRQAVNPTYYSGGDIQAEASNLADEEERRMAELAFLS